VPSELVEWLLIRHIKSTNERALIVSVSSPSLKSINVSFDDSNLVSNAGLLLISTLSQSLELEKLIDEKVSLSGSIGGANPGRKILTLVHAMTAGANYIDHVDMLRAGSTESVLGHKVMAPSTIGTFMRAFSFGHIRQLDSVSDAALSRAWAMGAGPGNNRLVIDIDSTICEVYGSKKQGANYGYTKCRCYHPLLAVRADTGEVIHARLRKGSANTARGVKQFIVETIARVRRAGATGEIVIRFDSGYWSKATLIKLEKLNVRYSMAIRAGTKGIKEIIEAIDEDVWSEIPYTPDGQAQVAETMYHNRRLVIRRTRLIGKQAELWPNWRYFGFLTDLGGTTIEADQFQRDRAVIELCIRDIKDAALEHLPSGNFSANGVWLASGVIAHNLLRWSALLGEITKVGTFLASQTMRTRFISIAARLVNASGRLVLRGPKHWPWAQQFITALSNLRVLTPATG
jgi:hypothetical protein